MAEELALQQVLWDRAAVDGQKDVVLSLAAGVNGRATTSFPTPLSPLIKTVVGVGAAR
jgi:hypothetical protein